MKTTLAEPSPWLRKLIFWGGLLIGLTWAIYRLLANQAWILDDEICHYLFSRSVWENPELIFNNWTRPGRNFVHVLAAPLGFTFTRFFTLALALLSFWFTLRVGRKLGVKALWSLPILLFFQAWFPELSYPILTQTPFMLFWIMGVWFGLTGRWHWAGFCFGYLSLIRHEGILLTALWGIWVTCQSGGLIHGVYLKIRRQQAANNLGSAFAKDSLFGLSTVSAIVIYNAIAYLSTGSIPFAVYFDSNPTDIYGSGTLFHYVPLLIAGLGGFSFLLSMLGFLSLKGKSGRWSLLLLTYVMYFVMHSLIYWRGAFASGGYYHFLMPMAPFFALLSANTIGTLLECASKKWQRCLVWTSFALVVFQGLNMLQQQSTFHNWQDQTPKDVSMVARLGHFVAFKWGAVTYREATFDPVLVAPPLKKSEFQQKLAEASEWCKKTYPDNDYILCRHVSHSFLMGHLMTPERDKINLIAKEDLPVGAVFIWDSKYADLKTHQWEFSYFANNPDWKLVKTFAKSYQNEGAENPQDKYIAAVFLKVSRIAE